MVRDGECIGSDGAPRDKWSVTKMAPVPNLQAGEGVCSVCGQVFALRDGALIPPHPRRFAEPGNG
ncbi:MAG: hypothetical protein ABI317_09755 [Gaiellales bacterium]